MFSNDLLVSLKHSLDTNDPVVNLWLCLDIYIHRFWAQYEAQAGSCRVKAALLRVVRRHLTPPPTSTNVERLFSYCGIVLDSRRASMNPENLDWIMFIRENLFLLNFKIEW